MYKWVTSKSGDRGFFHDEVAQLKVLAYGHNDRVFADMTLSSLGGETQYEMCLGPFVHLGALTEAVSGFLILVGAEAGNGKFSDEVSADDALPKPRGVAPNRAAATEAMHPRLAADLMFRAQQSLDMGDDPMVAVARLEQSYKGPRVDPKPLSAYKTPGALDIVRTAAPEGPRMTAAVPDKAVVITDNPIVVVAKPTAARPGPDAVSPASATPAAAPAAQPTPAAPATPGVAAASRELPKISILPQVRALQTGPTAVPQKAGVIRMPRAGLPAQQSGVEIDWSRLPVLVVEQKITQALSLLKAQSRPRPSAR